MFRQPKRSWPASSCLFWERLPGFLGFEFHWPLAVQSLGTQNLYWYMPMQYVHIYSWIQPILVHAYATCTYILVHTTYTCTCLCNMFIYTHRVLYTGRHQVSYCKDTKLKHSLGILFLNFTMVLRMTWAPLDSHVHFQLGISADSSGIGCWAFTKCHHHQRHAWYWFQSHIRAGHWSSDEGKMVSFMPSVAACLW